MLISNWTMWRWRCVATRYVLEFDLLMILLDTVVVYVSDLDVEHR